MFRKLSDGTLKVSEWLMQLAFINVLWLLFTIAGLGLFGWAPATVATFGVLRKMLLSPEEDVPLFRTFLQLFRRDFFSANGLGFLIVLGGLSLYASGSIISEMDSSLFLKLLLLMVVFLFGVIILFLFPVFCHYQLSLQQTIRYSLAIGLANLHYLSLLVVIVILIIIVYGTLPATMIFYFISVPGLIIMHFSLKVFNKIETQSIKG
ncbi:YesL family protein [Halalkalibacter urbisdiaboli]|uniref:YesL family protein n=1 Tax=Halalkalibacter urbisdiaboli TaxID=1960589 RepID=UPI000B44581E|nr:DUF624 domain-containing protein [Halalkalibacter urbisdiaboli]